MQFSSTFIRVLWSPIPETKKISISQWLWKHYCRLERIRAKRSVCEQVWFVLNTVGWYGDSRTTGKFCNFQLHLSLETVFPVLKMTQIYYINMSIFFLENWQSNHKLSLPLSYKNTAPKKLSSQSNKIWNQGDLKNFPTL